MVMEEVIWNLIKGGGGVCGVVVAKEGEFSKYFTQEFKATTKTELAKRLHDGIDAMLVLFDEDLKER
jgi:hypothetical protein